MGSPFFYFSDFERGIQRSHVSAWPDSKSLIKGDWGRTTSGGRRSCADRSEAETVTNERKANLYKLALLANL